MRKTYNKLTYILPQPLFCLYCSVLRLTLILHSLKTVFRFSFFFSHLTILIMLIIKLDRLILKQNNMWRHLNNLNKVKGMMTTTLFN